MKIRTGFTLIETLLYIGLYSLIMTGIVVSVFMIIEGTQRLKATTMLQQEGSFMLSKIDWALTGISSVTNPALESNGTSLETVKTSGLSPIYIDLNSSEMTIRKGILGSPSTLDNTNVSVPYLFFEHLGTVNGPEWVRAVFTLTTVTESGKSLSRDFTTIKYLQK